MYVFARYSATELTSVWRAANVQTIPNNANANFRFVFMALSKKKHLKFLQDAINNKRLCYKVVVRMLFRG